MVFVPICNYSVFSNVKFFYQLLAFFQYPKKFSCNHSNFQKHFNIYLKCFIIYMHIIFYTSNILDVLKLVRNGLKVKWETLLHGKTNNNMDSDFFQHTLKEKALAALLLVFLCVCLCVGIMSSKYQFTSFDIAKKSLSHFHKACWYFSISSEVHWSVSEKEITGNSKIK